MKKIMLLTTLSASFLFSAVNLQTASKEELMCINGIGAKKADTIIKYREDHKIKSADDLLEIKGFGKKMVDKIKKGELTAKCSKANQKSSDTNKKSDEKK